MGKEYVKAVYCHFAFSNLCRVHHSGLDESEVGIKIARRIISSLRYVDDTTLIVESEEELKSLLLKVKEVMKKLA